MSAIRALQIVAVAVTSILDTSAAVAAQTGHGAPQCFREGASLPDQLPLVVFQTLNARESGGLLGTYLVDVVLYAIASTMPAAGDLLTVAREALTPLAFAAVGVDAVPETGGRADSEPLDPEDLPFLEADGVATTLTLAVYLTPE